MHLLVLEPGTSSAPMPVFQPTVEPVIGTAVLEVFPAANVEAWVTVRSVSTGGGGHRAEIEVSSNAAPLGIVVTLESDPAIPWALVTVSPVS